MLDAVTIMEIDRIKNLIVNFDWEITKQKADDDEIVLTITKTRSTSPKSEGHLEKG